MRPYPYQANCLSALASARQGGSSKELVVMATGLGKTMVAAFDIKRLLEKAPGRVLYLCHQNHILAQARKTFEKVLGSGYSFGNFHGTEKHLHEVDVLFASFQTMANWREAFLRDEFRYVVVDEVHHAQAETFRPTVQYFTPDFKLGLTATLKRTDGLDVGELFNGKPVFELGLYEALARKYLCDVDYRIMTDEIQTAGVLDTPVGKLSIAHLNRTIFIPKRDEEIARIIAEKTAHIQNPRVMVFCTSIQHAENMAALIPGAEYVHSGIKTQEKDDRLTAFHSGALTTVTTIDMFNEGIDVPEANVIVFLRSTASETIYLQQFGRGLRKADGKDNVLVLDFVANCERIEMVRELDARVRQFQEEMTQETTVTATSKVTDNSEPRNPLILTLDGVEFDERTWRLFEVIEGVREKSQGYTREQLIQQLQRKAKELGRAPKADEVNADTTLVSTTTLANCFGTYNAALEAAGLEINLTHGISRAELIRQLQQKRDALGRSPKKDEVVADADMASAKTFSKIFGSFNKALEAAGLAVNANRSHGLSAEQLISQLQRKAKELGSTPSNRDVVADSSMPSVGVFTRTFGSFNKALEAAGLVVARQVGASDQELITKLAQYVKTLGRLPKAADMQSAIRPSELPSLATYSLRFGWSEAVRRAAEYRPILDQESDVRLEVRVDAPTPAQEDSSCACTPSDLLTQVLTKAKSLGRPPRAGEVDADPAMASAKEIKAALRASSWTEVIGRIKPYL